MIYLTAKQRYNVREIKNIPINSDPFVDAVAWILAVLNDKNLPQELVVEDFRSKLEFLAHNLMKDSWERLFYSVFPNNKIPYPSIKKEFKKDIKTGLCLLIL